MPDDERNDDNVVAFPSSGPRDAADVREVAGQAADQLLATGMQPDQLIDLVASGFADRMRAWTRRPPEVGPPRDEVVVYRLRVDLDHVRPPIWRRLEVASDMTLSQLHEVLQTAMAWTDSHLHHFEFGPRRDPHVLPFLTDFDEEEGDEGIHERDVRLDQVLVDVGDRLFYEYDFGDSWEHTIRLEAVAPYDEAAPRARCVGGRRACPPEDCGGVGGYEQLLDALADPDAAGEWGRELLDWMPEDFDPDAFSAQETDQLLQHTLVESLEMLLPPRSELDESLVDLADLARPPGVLAALVQAAELEVRETPDENVRRRMVRPWTHLMELVGAEGLKLTQAGYLPPAVVTELAADLDQVEPWMGKANREDQTWPVAALRETATAMRLVRKLKGRLVLTKNGKRLLGDPCNLWVHIAQAVPFGQRHERHAGVIALLVLAHGDDPGEGVRRHGPPIFANAGWQVAGGMDQWAVYQAARSTLDVLDLLGGVSDRFNEVRVTPEGRVFARAALRARPS